MLRSIGLILLILSAVTAVTPSVASALESPNDHINARSGSVRGFIHSDAQGSIFLTMKGQTEPLKIQTPIPSVLRDLQKLKSGDFIIASGRIQSSDKTVVVDALESVGLQELLGIWRTDNWQVIEFRDFYKMNLYAPSSVTRLPIGLAKLREFSYVLAPESENRYSIFLTDDRSVHLGAIEFSNNKVEMTVFDSQTGEVAENISLSPLPQ